jgi:hypothetical protein
MTHIDYFIQQMEKNCKYYFKGKKFVGRIKSTSMYVVWKMNGDSTRHVNILFDYHTQGGGYGSIVRTQGYLDTNDPYITNLYSQLLDIYIRKTKEFLTLYLD